MTAWLLDNDDLLPVTIYRLSRELDWSYGQTRGTLLRLKAQNHIPIRTYEIMDPLSKKYKTKIAIWGNESEKRVLAELNELERNDRLKTIMDLETLMGIKKFMKKLLTWDEKVIPLVEEIADKYDDDEIYDKVGEYQFGLNRDEKTEIAEILKSIEVI